MGKNHMTVDSRHHLNDAQKKIKQKIMEDILQGLFGNLQKNQELFDLQSAWDLVGSILVMFNRDVLVHMFTSTSIVHCRKEIMKNLFSTIREQVNEKIRNSMQ